MRDLMMKNIFVIFLLFFAISVKGQTDVTMSESCAKKLSASESTPKLGALLSCLAEMDQEIQSLKNKNQTITDNDSIAKGAIVAFDRTPSKPCPDGWTVWREATSRVIIGAGNNEDSYEHKYIYDQYGNKLTPRGYREHGGSEWETLSIAQMPEHNHGNGIFDKLLVQNSKNTTSHATDSSGSTEINQKDTGAILSSGGGQAHNNMPPFVALYYCKKQ